MDRPGILLGNLVAFRDLLAGTLSPEQIVEPLRLSAAPTALESCWGPIPSPSPDFLWSLVALANFMRLSLLKGARAASSSAAWQEFGFRAGLTFSRRPSGPWCRAHDVNQITQLQPKPACEGGGINPRGARLFERETMNVRPVSVLLPNVHPAAVGVVTKPVITSGMKGRKSFPTN